MGMYLFSATETLVTFTEVNECRHLCAAVNVGICDTEERTIKNHLPVGELRNYCSCIWMATWIVVWKLV